MDTVEAMEVSVSEETAVAPTPVPILAKLKFLGIGAVVGLLLGGAGAGKVWFDMSSQVSAATESAAKIEAEAKDGMTKAASDLDAAKGQARVLKARVAAALAQYEFNRQNFGSAGDQVKVLREHLEAVDASVHGVDAAKLDAAKKAAMATNIEVAGDLPTQADQIRRMGAAIDALVK